MRDSVHVPVWIDFSIVDVDRFMTEISFCILVTYAFQNLEIAIKRGELPSVIDFDNLKSVSETMSILLELFTRIIPSPLKVYILSATSPRVRGHSENRRYSDRLSYKLDQ